MKFFSKKRSITGLGRRILRYAAYHELYNLLYKPQNRMTFAQDEFPRTVPTFTPHPVVPIPHMKLKLYDFQKEAVQFGLVHRKVLFTMDVGLGKTPVSLTIAHALNAYPILIICPSMLKLNWKNEIKKWVPDATLAVIEKSEAYTWGEKTLADQFPYVTDPSTAISLNPIIVINYDVLDRYQDFLFRRKWNALICDESSYVKSSKAIRTKVVQKLARSISLKMLLSATPFPNRPSELISQLKILDRLNDFGGWNIYVHEFCAAHQTRWGLDYTGASHLQELNTRLTHRIMFRKTKQEVLHELPDKQRILLPVDITNYSEYKQAENNLILWLREQVEKDHTFKQSLQGLSVQEQRALLYERKRSKETAARRAFALVKINALRQLVAQGKLKTAIEWIENFIEPNNAEKLVIFAHHKSIQKALIDKFPNSAFILGGQSSLLVEQNKQKFYNDPTCRIMICSLLAGNMGHSLTVASNCLFIEFGWNEMQHEQAEGRLHRLSQKNAVNCFYFLAPGTIDEWTKSLIEDKSLVTSTIASGHPQSFIDNISEWFLNKKI